MDQDFLADVARIQNIPAVPTILDVVCRATGMGFAAVARVTEDRWIACQVLDNIDFGLAPGDELEVQTTLCHEVREMREVIAFDDAAAHPDYCNHHTPNIYHLRSYISVPIILGDGSFFGTLCAIDPKPAKVDNPQIRGTFQLFAELIAHHIDSAVQLDAAKTNLALMRDEATLREQFVAILGHDLRNPLAAIDAGLNLLERRGWTERTPALLAKMKLSVVRMGGLIGNTLDFARARLGGGLALDLRPRPGLRGTLEHAVDEIRVHHPANPIAFECDLREAPEVDESRIAQMLSNLLANAVAHGAPVKPITVTVRSGDGAFELTVANSGSPIPRDILPHLFQPFTRDRTHGEGLGLGLYITDQIARAHGGSMAVESGGQETRFTFRIASGSNKPGA